MAVNDESTNNDGLGQERRDQAQAQTRTERPARESQGYQAGLLDINRLLGAPMSRRTSGEVLVSAIKAVKFWFDPERNVAGSSNIDLSKIEIMGLEATEHNVSLSSVILALPIETNNGVKVLVHSLALGQSLLDEVAVRNVEISGRTYPLPVVPSDYVTESYLALIDDIVKKKFEATRRSIEIVRAGWRIVDKGVDFNDPESTEVRSVVFYSQVALTSTNNDAFNNDVYFNLDWLSKQSSLEINVDMSGRESYTADGLPRRSDLSISVAGIIRKGEQSLPIGLSSIGGYVELVYTPPAQEERWKPAGRRGEPHYTPTFIINRMDSANNAITPELLLLALGAASVVTKDQAWAQTFLPNDLARGETDFKDTGLLNILGPDEDNSPVVFDGRSSLDVNKWGQYFFSLVDDKLAWAIELEEGGDNSWLTSLLSDAANDTSADGSAVRRLYAYCDRLTNGNFTRRARELGVETPLVASGARYLTGTWIDENGKVRDLRDWDLLRWMATNPSDEGESAMRYQDIVGRTDLDVEIRVSEQYDQLTQALTASGVHFARYVELAYIDPKFVEAIAAAIVDCKINIDQRQAHYNFGARRVRGNSQVRGFVGGDLTHGMTSGRRTMGDGSRNQRGGVGNGFGHGPGF
jgi:hypothetical protein